LKVSLPSEVARRTLERLAELEERGATIDALLFTAQLFGRAMTKEKDDWVYCLDWKNAEVLFHPESLCVWNAATCRQDRFLKGAFSSLLANDESGSFRHQLCQAISGREVDPAVKALLIVWSADRFGCPEVLWGNYRTLGYGLDDTFQRDDWDSMEWVDRFLTLASDSPAVSCLLPSGDPVVEGIVKKDGIYRGSRNLTALILHKMSRGLLLWLCQHECFRTLRYIVETYSCSDLPLSYATILCNAIRALRGKRKGNNDTDFNELVKAIERRSPGLLGSYADSYGNTLLWSALHLAMKDCRSREVSLSRCKILRENGCLCQKENRDGISWDCIENEVRLCPLK